MSHPARQWTAGRAWRSCRAGATGVPSWGSVHACMETLQKSDGRLRFPDTRHVIYPVDSTAGVGMASTWGSYMPDYLRLVVDNSSSSDKSTPHFRASRKIGICHSPGTRPRASHLRAASGVAPAATPNSRISRQLSEDDSARTMRHHMDKRSSTSTPKTDYLSCPENSPRKLRKSRMQRILARSEFNAILAARVQRFREAAGKTQEEVARVLGVSVNTYSKYEGRRTRLPHDLIDAVCIIVSRSPAELLTHRLDRHDQAILKPLRPAKRA